MNEKKIFCRDCGTDVTEDGCYWVGDYPYCQECHDNHEHLDGIAGTGWPHQEEDEKRE